MKAPLFVLLLLATTAFATEVEVDVEAEEEETLNLSQENSEESKGGWLNFRIPKFTYAPSTPAATPAPTQPPKPTRESAIKKFAPIIKIAETDETRPESVDRWLENVDVYVNHGQEKLTWAQAKARGNQWLSSLSGDVNYFGNRAGENSRAGMNLVNNEVVAPIYVHTVEKATHNEIIYMGFWAWNWCQGFEWKKINWKFRWDTYYFHYCDFAKHEGDWEFVSVRVSKDWSTPLKIFLSAHGDANPTDLSSVAWEGSHPVVYSARNSHAFYTHTGFHHQAEVDLKVRKIKIGDKIEDGPRWNTQNHIVDVDTTKPAWLSFGGDWGFNYNFKARGASSTAPGEVKYFLQHLVNLLGKIQKVGDKMKLGPRTGPTAPAKQNFWQANW
eukprot:TRINITY_DN1766_c0_g1_i6.p1 TRINITY_DN1766_c0_g1~~TRINITY_DN1766_c0_g1_i6.p1  ORF type:complete len:410 (-),score=176.87 TRINITY_DN1766_c0_g1_i6:177-1331(-)